MALKLKSFSTFLMAFFSPDKSFLDLEMKMLQDHCKEKVSPKFSLFKNV